MHANTPEWQSANPHPHLILHLTFILIFTVIKNSKIKLNPNRIKMARAQLQRSVNPQAGQEKTREQELLSAVR